MPFTACKFKSTYLPMHLSSTYRNTLLWIHRTHMIIFLHRNFILVHMNYETATEKYRPQTDNFQIILLSISRPGNKSFVYWKNLHSFPRAFDSKLSFFFCVPSFSMIRIYQHKVGKIAVFVFSFYLFVYSLWT